MAWVWRLLALLMMVFLPLRAAGETVSADFSLVMGDNDSRTDARNLCYINAKRRALEKAGVFIEAQTHVVNLVLKSQDVIAFTAAVARVEEGGHSFQVSGDQQVAKCTVRVTVDPDDLKRRLAEYASDTGLRDRIRSQQQRITELEGRIVSISEALRTAGADQALAMRRQRSDAFLDFRAVEAALASWSVREERLQRLKRLTQQYVKVGMTRDEVRAILGPPDGTFWSGYSSSWEYGPQAKMLTIIFDTAGKDRGLSGDGYVLSISGADKK